MIMPCTTILTGLVVEIDHFHGRIRVSLPSLPDNPSVWMSAVGTGATDRGGLWWPPTLGDEVVVAAASEDFATGYVLGPVWSGQSHPPDGITPANGVAVVGDQQAGTLSVQSAAGPQVLVGPTAVSVTSDRTGVKLEFDDVNGSVRISAPRDLQLSTAGTIRLTGSTIELRATALVTIDGGLVKIN
jgi:phage baseplate assembly protein V